MPVEQLVAMNDLKRLYARYQAEIEQNVLDTLRSGGWLNGSKSQQFARNFSKFIGVTDCIPVGNGTDALELALRAVLEIRNGRGSEIILAANAGGYASCACWHNGATAHYVDIDESSQLISIPAALSAAGGDTAAIIITHLYGGTVDVPAVRDGLARAGLADVPIIEDCAQAHGARIRGQRVGSFGDVATFSFYPTKNLGAMGDGGAVLTSDDAIAERVRMLHQYGWNPKYHVQVKGGRNSRMDEVQAAALDVFLPYLDDRNRERVAILDRYRSITGRRLRFVDGGQGAVAHLAVAICDDRDGLRAFLADRGIGTDIHYPVLDCDQPGWAGSPMKGADGLQVSQACVRSICTVPCYPEMTANEVERVCAGLAVWEAM